MLWLIHGLKGGFEAATQQPLVTPNSHTSALELS